MPAYYDKTHKVLNINYLITNATKMFEHTALMPDRVKVSPVIYKRLMNLVKEFNAGRFSMFDTLWGMKIEVDVNMKPGTWRMLLPHED